MWKSQVQEKVTAAGNLHYLVIQFSTIESIEDGPVPHTTEFIATFAILIP